MRKILAFSLLFTMVLAAGFAQEKKTAFSLFGGIHYVLKYGSESDYSPGDNDFPTTPAHTPPTFGLSFLYQFSGLLGLEVDGRYTLSSKVTLTDPSDGDTVSVDTLRHAGLTLNVLLFLGNGSFRPYLTLGAGSDVALGAKEQTLTTSLGYEVTFLPPEQKAELMADAGLGLMFNMGPMLGLRLDVRYLILPKNSNHPLIHNMSAAGGLFIRLF
ncbi:MAG TPA: outer membrane beta-barrel protein [Acidobacteriota bacterium]